MSACSSTPTISAGSLERLSQRPSQDPEDTRQQDCGSGQVPGNIQEKESDKKSKKKGRKRKKKEKNSVEEDNVCASTVADECQNTCQNTCKKNCPQVSMHIASLKITFSKITVDKWVCKLTRINMHRNLISIFSCNFHYFVKFCGTLDSLNRQGKHYVLKQLTCALFLVLHALHVVIGALVSWDFGVCLKNIPYSVVSPLFWPTNYNSEKIIAL